MFTCVVLYRQRRPCDATRVGSAAASDGYKRHALGGSAGCAALAAGLAGGGAAVPAGSVGSEAGLDAQAPGSPPVSYTHLRSHETVLDPVCRLSFENKNIRTLRDIAFLNHMSSFHRYHSLTDKEANPPSTSRRNPGWAPHPTDRAPNLPGPRPADKLVPARKDRSESTPSTPNTLRPSGSTRHITKPGVRLGTATRGHT